MRDPFTPEPVAVAMPVCPEFQSRVLPWLLATFGPEITDDAKERNHRFLEESLELVQSCGATASESHQLVDYVFSREIGETHQEIGGVMVTLAALCNAQRQNMHSAGEVELARIWTKVEQIRAKQAAKPKHSPLPAAAPVAVAEAVPVAHVLKTLPHYFNSVLDGSKRFEIRVNDRNYRVGDWLVLREWCQETGFSGREIHNDISYVTEFAQKSGWVVLGFTIPEIDRLASENADLRARVSELERDLLQIDLDRLTEQRDAARAEADALRQDKARLDWLESKAGIAMLLWSAWNLTVNTPRTYIDSELARAAATEAKL